MFQFPDGYSPQNFCRSCGVDFTSLAAFDAHLGGSAEDRVHLSPAEAGLEHRKTVDGVERYGLILSEPEKNRLAVMAGRA